MKNLFFIPLIIIANNLFAQNQPILSGIEGFENWEQSATGELPQFWDGFNKSFIDSLFIDSVITVRKDSINPQSGNYSVKLKSIDFYGVPIQGLLTHGNFSVDFMTHEGKITGGIPTHERPIKFNGYYKYFPINYDVATISVWFMKGVDSEIIGEGKMEISQTISSWTEFSIDIQYYTEEEPDTMNIFFTTSSNPFNIQVGSVLEIDNVWLESTASISREFSNLDLSIYPNPAKDYINISSLNTVGEYSLKIINSVGEIVISKTFCSSSNFNKTIAIKNLPDGVYYVELKENKKRIVKKLVIFK